MRLARLSTLVAAFTCSACFGASNQDSPSRPQGTDDPAGSPAVKSSPVDPRGPLSPLGGIAGAHVVVPVDERAPVTAEVAPPPISGGTLMVTADGLHAVASDPERDRVVIVDVQARSVTADIALEPGDEPGRLVEDDAGRVHVALRRGGAIATIDLASASVVSRRDVCGAPRGVAFDADSQMLDVACADGALVRLPVEAAEPTERVMLGPDLRDVVVGSGHTFVSRFKGTQLLAVEGDAMMAQTEPPVQYGAVFDPRDGSTLIDAFQANVAWRTVADPQTAGMAMVHQSSRMGEIELPKVNEDGSVDDTEGSSYGGGGECSGVVQGAITTFDAEGDVVSSARIQAVLPVDLAVDANWLAVAQAGTQDAEQPAREIVLQDGSNLPLPPSAFEGPVGGPGGFISAALGTGPDVLVYARQQVDEAMEASSGGSGCMFPFFAMDVPGQAVATTFLPDGRLAIQSREPATVSLVSVQNGVVDVSIPLGGAPMKDTGHEIFHRDAGSGVACASCHAEGAEDGHVWTFADFGPRRTQALHVGLRGTEPFHWEGDKEDFSMLMEDVFVARMGGVHQSPERLNALAGWLFTLTPPSPLREATDAAAARGKELFEGEGQCNTCHTGTALTNNETVDVGTGGMFQVPSLVGIGYRAPFVHDGCASDLRQRFDTSCGGDQHGNVEGLDEAEIGDLVAYLETL